MTASLNDLVPNHPMLEGKHHDCRNDYIDNPDDIPRVSPRSSSAISGY